MDLDNVAFLISMSIFIICGTVGNSLVIAVYLSKKHRFPKRVYVLTLAIVDLVVVVLVAPYTIVFELRLVTSDFVCHVFEVVRHTVIIYSNTILILIAWERLLMVWKPFRIIKHRTKMGFILGFLVFSLLWASPSAVTYSVDFHGNRTSSGNSTFAQERYCGYTTTILGEWKSLMYRDFLAFSIVLVLLILMVTYILVYIIIYRQRRKLPGVFSGSSTTYSVLETSKRVDKTRKQNSHNEPVRSNDDDCLKYNEVFCISKSLFQGTALDVEGQPTESHNVKRLHEVFSNTTDQTRWTTTKSNQQRRVMSREKFCTDLEKTLQSSTESNALPERRHLTNSKLVRSAQRRATVDTKTWTMLSICTLLYIICWIPFFAEILNMTKSLVLRYLFFIGHMSNPIIYSIVNVKIRRGIRELFIRKPNKGLRHVLRVLTASSRVPV